MIQHLFISAFHSFGVTISDLSEHLLKKRHIKLSSSSDSLSSLGSSFVLKKSVKSTRG